MVIKPGDKVKILFQYGDGNIYFGEAQCATVNVDAMSTRFLGGETAWDIELRGIGDLRQFLGTVDGWDDPEDTALLDDGNIIDGEVIFYE